MKKRIIISVAMALAMATLASIAEPAYANSGGWVQGHVFCPIHITEASKAPSANCLTQTVRQNQPFVGSPDLRGVYVKGSRSNPNITFPASWYLRDVNGNKVLDKVHHLYVMDPLSGWGQHVAQVCAQAMSSRNATICFVDGLGATSLGRASHPLIDPRTKRPYTAAEWLQDAGTMVKSIEDSSSSYHVVANSVGNGADWFRSDSPTSLLGSGIWGASSEQFTGTQPAKQIAFIQATHVWAICKDDSAAGRSKALAVFLLAAGSGDRFDSYSWSDGAGTWYSQYNINLGRPLKQVVKLQRSVWKRLFSNGAVFLNNTNRVVRAKAGGHTYKLQPKKQRFVVFS